MDQQNRSHVGLSSEELGGKCAPVKPDIVNILKTAKHSFVDCGTISCDICKEKNWFRACQDKLSLAPD